MHDAGKIRDPKVNRAIAEELVARWRKTAGVVARHGAEWKSEIRRGEQAVGWQTLTLAEDGEWLKAGGNAVLSVVLCLLGVWLGHVLALSINAGRQ